MEPGNPRRQAMNEHRRRLFGDADRSLALICECDDPDCRETVLLTVAEYDDRRPDPILHPSHAAQHRGAPA
jgi:hypothetical protein